MQITQREIMAEQTRMESRAEGERIAHLEGQIAHLATKADVENLRAEMNSNTAQLNSSIAVLDSKIAVLDSKIEGLHAELRMIRWIIGLAIPAAIAITGIVVQVLNNPP